MVVVVVVVAVVVVVVAVVVVVVVHVLVHVYVPWYHMVPKVRVRGTWLLFVQDVPYTGMVRT